MNLQTFMIGTTFLLGVGTMLFGLLALWKNKAAGGTGTFKTLGIEASGTGGVVIVMIGAAFVLSCFRWATTQKQAEERAVELGKAAVAIQEYQVSQNVLRATLREVSPDALLKLEATVPSVKTPPRWSLPADLSTRFPAHAAPRPDHP